MDFTRILEAYRAYSYSERGKGARFERLMQAWLRTDFGGKDTVIDLVARTENGDYWAIPKKGTSDRPAPSAIGG